MTFNFLNCIYRFFYKVIPKVFYKIFKTLVSVSFHLFYRKVTVYGKEHLLQGCPLMVLANHRNAAMDAFLLVSLLKQDLFFFARADLFRNPFLKVILFLFHVRPIYRERDGYYAVKQNINVMREAASLMLRGASIVILPEGTHAPPFQIRSFHKGFAKIAVEGELQNTAEKPLCVLPVSIDYNCYGNFRGYLTAFISPPLNVRSYVKIDSGNIKKAVVRLKTDSEYAVKQHTVYYDTFFDTAFINRTAPLSRAYFSSERGADYYRFEKAFVGYLTVLRERDPLLFHQVKMHSKKLVRLSQKLKIPSEIIFDLNCSLGQKEIYVIIFGLLSSPFWITGFVFNVLPGIIVSKMTKMTCDLQFKDSVKFISGFFLFPLFYLLEYIFVYRFWTNGNGMPSVLYVFTAGLLFFLYSILSGIFFYRVQKKIKILFKSFELQYHKLRKERVYEEWKKAKNDLKKMFKSSINDF